jgi:hypothetical protein
VADPFMIEFRGEILAVTSMLDAAGKPTEDRSKARQFGVTRENGKPALLRLPHPETHLTKIERH